ncbi:MAG: N-acetylmuramoyl-L-alanine amidase [Actinomycetota bacterium]|nr:N-acetylmuramoyl-L-alanine amidase [Actinomycetota bacterium]
MNRGAWAATVAAGAVVLGFLAWSPAVAEDSPVAESSRAATRPLAGRLIVLDPGHQLGNSNPKFAKQMSQTMFNGSIVKGCNTSGTATNAGYPESTFNWRVAKRLKTLLEDAGARVEMTRTTNSYDDWGPCVWDRAGLANRLGADAMISIHGDGAGSSSKGFFAIAPVRINGWTDDVVAVDRRLAKAMIAGMIAAGAVPANYVSGQLLLSRDTTSLNLSNVPTTTIELGNMRNAQDARRMSSASGQEQYARWLLAGLERFFR